MRQRRTLQIFALLLVVYALACLPAVLGLPFLEDASSWFLLVPFFTPHVLHRLGIPGLLEHDGYCGWGWCSPSALGWIFLVAFWLAIAWLLAWGLARFVKSDRAAPPRAGL